MIIYCNRNGRFVAVDVERLFVYCSQCKDYIYDAEFLYIRELEDTHAQEDEANAKGTQEAVDLFLHNQLVLNLLAVW